jgi:hypothetical protein
MYIYLSNLQPNLCCYLSPSPTSPSLTKKWLSIHLHSDMILYGIIHARIVMLWYFRVINGNFRSSFTAIQTKKNNNMRHIVTNFRWKVGTWCLKQACIELNLMKPRVYVSEKTCWTFILCVLIAYYYNKHTHYMSPFWDKIFCIHFHSSYYHQ